MTPMERVAQIDIRRHDVKHAAVSALLSDEEAMVEVVRDAHWGTCDLPECSECGKDARRIVAALRAHLLGEQ